MRSAVKVFILRSLLGEREREGGKMEVVLNPRTWAERLGENMWLMVRRE